MPALALLHMHYPNSKLPSVADQLFVQAMPLGRLTTSQASDWSVYVEYLIGYSIHTSLMAIDEPEHHLFSGG